MKSKDLEHKEKLRISKNIDVITLTATPIQEPCICLLQVLEISV